MHMISEADVRKALQKVVPAAPVATWSVDYRFTEGALDSLDVATLALHLDEQHGVKIPDGDLPALTSIRAIVEYANGERKAGG
jgi:acyl carrier protein